MKFGPFLINQLTNSPLSKLIIFPCVKVINLISRAHNLAEGSVKDNLGKALGILRSNELYNPSSYLENDIQTNALVNGLMTVIYFNF